VPGWTDPPGFIADRPILNVPFRERYALAAVALMALTLARATKTRRSVPDPDAG
jgi:hypothetical protein